MLSSICWLVLVELSLSDEKRLMMKQRRYWCISSFQSLLRWDKRQPASVARPFFIVIEGMSFYCHLSMAAVFKWTLNQCNWYYGLLVIHGAKKDNLSDGRHWTILSPWSLNGTKKEATDSNFFFLFFLLGWPDGIKNKKKTRLKMFEIL